MELSEATSNRTTASPLAGAFRRAGRVTRSVPFLAVGLVTTIAALDVGFGLRLTQLLVAGPCLAALSARPRIVAAIGGYVLVLAVLLASPNHTSGTTQEATSVGGALAVSAAAVLLAARRQRLQVAIDEAGQLAAIVEHSEDAMLTATADGVITSWNRGAEQLFGYPRTDIVGRSLAAAAVEVRATLARIIGGSGVERYQSTEFHRDGTQREVSVSAFPIRSADGTVVGRSAVCRDVTAAARLESEQASLRGQLHVSQRLESLGQLAGGVAHDFNNLLAVISGSAELIDAESDQPQAVRADVAVIASAAARAGGLTRQLLAFARGEPIPVQHLDVADVVSGIASLLERTVGAPITVELRATSTRPPLVRADRGRLEQVLLNLAVNARDAMPDGGTLTIATRLVELVERQAGLQPPPSPGTYVELAVTDTGIGMTAETVSHIFEPFYTTKQRDSGTGLGLATVYGVVADAEGSIAVESELQRGTTFRVYLPVAD